MMQTPDPKNLITCSSCYRSLPEAFFGRTLYRKSGHQAHCSKCHNERNSYYNCIRTGWTPKVHTQDLIYNVKRHNSTILLESTTIDMELIGYGVKDKCLYRIIISKGQFLDKAMRIYKGDVPYMAFEYGVSNMDKTLETLLKLLKQDYIRLERSEIDLINVKTLIYDLGE